MFPQMIAIADVSNTDVYINGVVQVTHVCNVFNNDSCTVSSTNNGG